MVVLFPGMNLKITFLGAFFFCFYWRDENVEAHWKREERDREGYRHATKTLIPMAGIVIIISCSYNNVVLAK